MPPTKTQSKLVAKLGAAVAEVDKAVQEHASDPTNYGFINLPPGIGQGVARLQSCYFDEYKNGEYKGKMFFRAVGVVITPEVVDNQFTNGPMVTRGLTTSVMIPCCDTKNTKGVVTAALEHISGENGVMNVLRQLGGEDYTAGATVHDLESLAAGLVEAAPYFKFSTSPRIAQQDGPNTKKGQVTGAWENWHGTKGLEDFVEPEQNSVNDSTTPTAPPPVAPPKPSTNGHKAPTASAPAPTPPKKGPGTKTPTPPPAPEPEPEPEAEIDLDALAEDAGSKSDTSGASGEQLTAIAIEAGVPEKDANEAKTWTGLVLMIRKVRGEEIEEPVDEEEPWQPQLGETYGYRPIDPKTRKPVKDAVNYDVIGVDVNKQTVDLKSGKATVKGVAWDKLDSAV